LYSLAILLYESGLRDVQMLGTDCRSEAIRSAQQGEFPLAALEKLDGSWRKHFVCCGEQVRIADCLRTDMNWKRADLLKGAEAGPWDVVLWRNMAIYLRPEIVETIWQAIIDQLAANAFVISGKADHLPRNMKLEKVSTGIYRKK
jgi:chemotaxis protein methyltransferase CheR